MLFKKIDPDSVNSINEGLSLFDTPPTNVTSVRTGYREWIPSNPISDIPYRFSINTGASVVDLSKTYYVVDLHVEKEDRSVPGGWRLPRYTQIAPQSPVEDINLVNGAGLVFIEQLKLTLNQTEIYSSNHLYAYKMMVDLLTSFPQSSFNQLKNSGLYLEKRLNTEADPGYSERKRALAEGHGFQYTGFLDADIFNQPRYLIPQCDLEIEIIPRLRDHFLLQSLSHRQEQEKFRVVISSLRIYTLHYELAEGMALSLNEALLLRPAKYPIRRTEMRSFFITGGRREWYTTVNTNIVPTRLFMMLVDKNAFSGLTLTTPFKFLNANVENVEVTAAGRVFPSTRYRDISFKENRFARLYHDFCDALDVSFSHSDLIIDPIMYKNDFTIFCVDLSTSMARGEEFELLQSGQLAISFKFSEPTPDSGLSLVVYSECPGIITIDGLGTVSNDLVS